MDLYGILGNFAQITTHFHRPDEIFGYQQLYAPFIFTRLDEEYQRNG